MSKRIAVMCGPLSQTIWAGSLSADGTRFVGQKHDVTQDAVLAVIRMVLDTYPEGMTWTNAETGEGWAITVEPWTKGGESRG